LEPSGLGTEGGVFYKYRLHEADGSEGGEAHYAFLMKPGETIITGAGRKLRVLNVVAVEEEDSPYVGLLLLEPV
jgi:hypothetical protein